LEASQAMGKRVLIVDDDRLVRELARDTLAEHGFCAVVASSGHEALRLLAEAGPFEVVITDLSMREMDGLQLLERIKRAHPKTDVIILTAYASLESALEAMRLGAADYLRKPMRPPEILYGVQRTMLRRRMVSENVELRASLQAFEATRVLTSCLESGDLIPLALDILLRLVDRERAVARLLHVSPALPESVHLRGFAGRLADDVRAEIESGKALDPSSLDPTARSCRLSLPETLRDLGMEDEEILALPLRLDSTIAGALFLFSDGRRFGEIEVGRAELIAAQTELALVNAERFLQAREKAFVDDVTDLYNARYLLSALDREVSRASRSQLELSVLFLDLDRFKLVNDHHGHLVGSRVLRELGQLLQRSVRSIDTVARYGGDEFTILLVETGQEGAMQVADRIRRTVEETPFGGDRGLKLAVTCSIGVATYPVHGHDREQLLDLADKAMYRSKSLGRNRICSVAELLAG
jgi:diguanylate cyclase (GGDEF)-like protein